MLIDIKQRTDGLQEVQFCNPSMYYLEFDCHAIYVNTCIERDMKGIQAVQKKIPANNFYNYYFVVNRSNDGYFPHFIYLFYSHTRYCNSLFRGLNPAVNTFQA